MRLFGVSRSAKPAAAAAAPAGSLCFAAARLFELWGAYQGTRGGPGVAASAQGISGGAERDQRSHQFNWVFSRQDAAAALLVLRAKTLWARIRRWSQSDHSLAALFSLRGLLSFFWGAASQNYTFNGDKVFCCTKFLIFYVLITKIWPKEETSLNFINLMASFLKIYLWKMAYVAKFLFQNWVFLGPRILKSSFCG